ncbi:MAG: hypothetical protein J6Y77_07785 [Paludibacteraceae bacterium]|nr:hypothetical protein [Paludibacteraceae bacterium]
MDATRITFLLQLFLPGIFVLHLICECICVFRRKNVMAAIPALKTVICAHIDLIPIFFLFADAIGKISYELSHFQHMFSSLLPIYLTCTPILISVMLKTIALHRLCSLQGRFYTIAWKHVIFLLGKFSINVGLIILTRFHLWPFLPLLLVHFMTEILIIHCVSGQKKRFLLTLVNIAGFYGLCNIPYAIWLYFKSRKGKKHQSTRKTINARQLVATFVCLITGCASAAIYTHILFATPALPIIEKTPYGLTVTSQASYIKFEYIDKEKHLLEAVEYRTHNDCNLVIPDSIVYNGTTYHVLSATTYGHCSNIQCNTLYLPASLVYFNHEQLLDRNKVGHIVVAPDNRYYRSVDGDLFLGDSLLFDTHFSYQDQLTDEEY